MRASEQRPCLDRQQARADLIELLALLVGPLPGVPVPRVLVDRTPDPGLFGPGSVTWRLAREPLLLLGGGRALLMQVAHPLVAQGVADHSDYASRPFGRLLGTVHWLVRVIFGTRAEAEAASRRVAGVHAGVRGTLAARNATARLAGETAYSARDPALALWVHATIVESMLVACDRFLGPLSGCDADRLVREWAPVGELMGVDCRPLWHTCAELRAYVAQQIDSGTVAPVAASRRIAQTVLRPPLPWPASGPLSAQLGFLSAGLLPPPLRVGYHLRWKRHDDAAFAGLCALIRAAQPLFPRRLRVTPLYDVGIARLLPKAS